MRQAIMLVAAWAIPAAAAAGDMRLATGSVGPDVRLLNHFPYPAAARSDLARPPRALAGNCSAIHRDMRADLEAMLARAQADRDIGHAIVAVSCFRSRQYQSSLFYRRTPGESLSDQAYQVAPPGFSEHATGYAIDFGERGGRCKLITCFANTKVGRWLAKNAPDFGFEMSFPEDNAQGVAFEPWHWRWVGRDESDAARLAQATFAATRTRFPSGIEPAGNGEPGVQLTRFSPFVSDVERQVTDDRQAMAVQPPSPAVPSPVEHQPPPEGSPGTVTDITNCNQPK